MQVKITPSAISGTISAPASKSAMQRACAAALVRNGQSIIHRPGHSNDDKAALDVIKQLGAIWTESNGSITIQSQGLKNTINTNASGEASIHCGESGLGIRMFAPLVALHSQLVTIQGSGSLLTRPMDFFDSVFPQLGITIQTNAGKLPISIQGPLVPTNITIDGSLSSQFLTGLLFAYAALNASDVTIVVNNLKSTPYIDLTLDVIQAFGLKLPVNNNYQSFYFDSTSIADTKTTIEYTVEGDWSGGAFLLVAGAIANAITVEGLDQSSSQADKAIMQALKDAGANIETHNNQISIAPAPLTAFSFDATDCPDLFPPLVALAAYCQGITTIKGVSRLAHKESNRALTLQEEFGKMGVSINIKEDTLYITGTKNILGTTVHSHHDHRIAMACAIAALKATGTTIIQEAEAVNKSFPDFYEVMQQLGVQLEIIS